MRLGCAREEVWLLVWEGWKLSMSMGKEVWRIKIKPVIVKSSLSSASASSSCSASASTLSLQRLRSWRWVHGSGLHRRGGRCMQAWSSWCSKVWSSRCRHGRSSKGSAWLVKVVVWSMVNNRRVVSGGIRLVILVKDLIWLLVVLEVVVEG